MTSAIEFRSVVKDYGSTRALDDLSVAVPAGALVGFLGPNGAGKTTSFRAMLGLTRPTSGSIEVLGMPVDGRVSDIVKRVGAVIEEPGLHKTLSAIDNLQVTAHMLGRGHDRITELLDFVDLTDAARRKAGQYSKGMRQRLALAQAMLGDPELLVLDEPLDGLDPAGQVVLKQRLRDLVTEHGKTVVVSSHDLSDVEQLAEHVIVLNRGKLVAEGSLEALIGQAASYAVEVPDQERAVGVLVEAGIPARVVAGSVVATAADGADVSRALAGAGMYPSALVPDRSTLESVFLELTAEDR
jgi:ABC-2 type transport system ATP-binding protein